MMRPANSESLSQILLKKKTALLLVAASLSGITVRQQFAFRVCQKQHAEGNMKPG